MKTNWPLIITLAFCIIITNSSCKEDNEPAPERTTQDVQVDFANISLTSGIHDETLEFISQKVWNFRVIIPEITSGQSYPLIIDLHGASGGAPDAHQKTNCYVEPAFEGMDVFIISPNAGIELWHSFNNQEMVINLILMARSTWPIDKNKVVVTGYSNGGNGSWFFGETQGASGLISASIPMASSYTTVATDGSIRIMPIPMYVIHGANDELFPVQETQDWVASTVNEGSDVQLVIAPDLGHYQPCDYVPYLKDAITWLTTEVW